MDSTPHTHPHLPVAVGTPLLLDVVNIETRVKCELIGISSKDFLILRLCQADLAGNFRSMGVLESKIVIRYMYDGTVYGFETRVLNAVASPTRMLFVKYPEMIEEFNARTETRYGCILPAGVSVGEGEDEVEAVIVDISRSGCRCAVKGDDPPEAVEMDAPVTLKVQLPGVSEKATLKGKVRNISRDENRLTLGVQFDEMPEYVKASFEDFISLMESV